ncbi:hypothetical protein [Actinomycetospora sp.]|uniref:hypothetical protein n=1 Tax=Actinomycetospora sp. TaxID=1872135 RepID=UPI002F3EBBC0
MIVKTWIDRAARTGMDWLGREVLRWLDEPDIGAGATPAAETELPGIVVGGFAATAALMEPVVQVLSRRGHAVSLVTEGAGAGCAGRAADGLTREIETVTARSDRQVHLVGYSRGGQLGSHHAVAEALDRRCRGRPSAASSGSPRDRGARAGSQRSPTEPAEEEGAVVSITTARPRPAEPRQGTLTTERGLT